MKMLTRQEIFDKVAVHFAKTERPAVAGFGCAYRTPDGNKCFAGVLIKDRYYSKELEGNSAAHSEVEAALYKSGVRPGDLDFVYTLQNIHDQFWNTNGDNKNEVVIKLAEQARYYELSTVHPDLRQ